MCSARKKSRSFKQIYLKERDDGPVLLSLRQEVCEIPQWWCGDGHIPEGFKSRNPKQIKGKMSTDSFGKKKEKDTAETRVLVTSCLV